MEEKRTKGKRGFASLSPERLKEIARSGGRAAHQKGTGHEFTSEEARIAGRLGGRAVSKDRIHMRKISLLGVKKSAERAKAISVPQESTQI